MFKKVKFNVAEGSVVSTYEGKNKTIDEVISILKDPRVISFSGTKMTNVEYLKTQRPVNL